MRRSLRRVAATVLLMLTQIAAAPNATIGFADLRKLVAAHPLHATLATYDREITALQSTRNVAGLTDPAARMQRAAASVRTVTAGAALRAQRIDSEGTAPDLVEENGALAMILTLERSGDREASSYRVQLDRQLAQSLSAYRAATAQRTNRALEARRQQLHEKELTLAYDLARRDAPQRLMLRLQLSELHLDRAERADLEAQRALLDRRESDALAAMRRTDAVALAAYSRDLHQRGASDDAKMAAQLRGKAAANLATNNMAQQAQSSAGADLPSLPAQLAFFRSSYRASADAGAIAAGFRAASTDLSSRFMSLADSDAQSARETSAQLATLEKQRDTLYRAMVAQIERVANQLAVQRGLSRVVFARPLPKQSVDLTAAVRSTFAAL